MIENFFYLNLFLYSNSKTSRWPRLFTRCALWWAVRGQLLQKIFTYYVTCLRVIIGKVVRRLGDKYWEESPLSFLLLMFPTPNFSSRGVSDSQLLKSPYPWQASDLLTPELPPDFWAHKCPRSRVSASFTTPRSRVLQLPILSLQVSRWEEQTCSLYYQYRYPREIPEANKLLSLRFIRTDIAIKHVLTDLSYHCDKPCIDRFNYLPTYLYCAIGKGKP